MKLSEYFREHPVTEQQRMGKKLTPETAPQPIGLLKGKFIQTWNDLPESVREALYQARRVIWSKHQLEFLGTELHLHADGYVTDCHGLLPILTDGVSEHTEVIAGDATTDDERQVWSKVYRVLAKEV